MTMQQDPFASVRLKSNQNQASDQPHKPDQPPQQINQEDPFAEARIKKSDQFSGLYETGRHAARIGSRIAETLGGIPGDVESLIQSGLFAGFEKLTGKKIPEEFKEIRKKGTLPTSSELKELSIEKTGGFTAPQSEAEKTGDELAQTLASLLGPMKFRKALGVSVGSQIAKEGLKLAGVEEGTQEAGKLGTMFLLTMLNPKGAANFAKLNYEKADVLSRGASIDAVPFEGHLVNLVNDLKKGVSTSAKNTVIKPAEELIKKVKKGKILVSDLTSAKRDIHELMGEPETLKGAKKLLNVLGKEVDKAIKPYERLNPAFKEAYRPANEVFGAVMQGNKSANFIKRALGTKSLFGALVAEGALGHPEYLLPTIAGASGVMAGAKTIDFFTRLAKSPELQKYYANAMMAAAREDLSALRLYEEKIRDEFEKTNP